MKLASLEIKGFRVFEDFTFHFPQSPGLYLVTGENRDRPALGSNGVGKSTLFDTISYVLYGKSARELVAGDLARDGVKEMRVKLTTSAHVFERAWFKSRKAEVTLDGKNVGGNEVLDLVGLTHAMFTTSTVVPQLVSMFADLQPAEQVQMLQALLGLDRWLDYAEEAEVAAKKVDREIADLEREFGLWERDASHTEGQLQTAKGAVDTWAKQKEQRLKGAHEALAAAQEKAKPHASFATWKSELSALQTTFRRAASSVKTISARLEKIRSERAVVQGELTAIMEVMEGLAEDMRGFEQFTPGQLCPTCLQPITKEHRDSCVTTIHNKIAGKRDVADARALTYERLRREQDEATTALRLVTDKAAAADRDIKLRERWIDMDIARVRVAGATCQDAMVAIDDIADEENPWTSKVQELTAKHKEAQVEMVVRADEIAAAKARAEQFRLWKTSFKAIRTQLVNDALAQFALEIAVVLEDLGLIGWEVAPYIDPAVFESARNATGFRFMVKDPEGVERNLKAYSGGEFQRVRLVIQCALGALIADMRATDPFEFEVWDEPSSYLSQEGVLGLFAALKARAQRLARPIFVIDHHQVHAGEFTQVYNFVRESGKTILEA